MGWICIHKAFIICYSFTIETWVYWESSVPSGTLPILCTDLGIICMYVENGVLSGRVGDVDIKGSTTLTEDGWHHLVMRYEAESRSPYCVKTCSLNYSFLCPIV